MGIEEKKGLLSVTSPKIKKDIKHTWLVRKELKRIKGLRAKEAKLWEWGAELGLFKPGGYRESSIV